MSLMTLLLLAVSAPLLAAAQGLASSRRAPLGASNAQRSALAIFQISSSFRQAYRSNRAGACSKQAGSLCSSSAGADELAAITVAANPPQFDARDDSQIGGLNLVSPVRDQGNCYTCTSMAVIGAAEAAASAALRKSAANRRWSVQDLHMCSSGDTEVRTCLSSTFTMLDAIKAFLSRKRVVLDDCLPYTAPYAPLDANLCDYKCQGTDPDLSKGKFKFKELKTQWEMQAHLRKWGSVLTRMDIMSDTKMFFRTRPGDIYRPSKGATFEEGHAVLIVGYTNREKWWLVKSSWGPAFGLQGFVKVAFDAAATGIGAPEDTFGLIFETNTRLPPPFPLSAAPGGCYWAMPPPGTWIGAVAAQLEVDVRQLLVDNIDRIEALDKPLSGQQLLVCGVPEAVVRLATPPSSPPASRTPGPWRCMNFGLMVTRLDANGDTQCMTWPLKDTGGQPICYGTRMDYNLPAELCRQYAITPPKGSGTLSCGKQHAEIYGGTGYRPMDKDHWCTLGKQELLARDG